MVVEDCVEKSCRDGETVETTKPVGSGAEGVRVPLHSDGVTEKVKVFADTV